MVFDKLRPRIVTVAGVPKGPRDMAAWFKGLLAYGSIKIIIRYGGWKAAAINVNPI